LTARTHLTETADELLTPGEVARLFRVDPKTVTRWEKDGKLTSIRTLGGHRRYPRPQLTALFDEEPTVDEVIASLESVHALAVDIGATSDAARILRLARTLRYTA